jgi:hypothetical protein
LLDPKTILHASHTSQVTIPASRSMSRSKISSASSRDQGGRPCTSISPPRSWWLLGWIRAISRHSCLLPAPNRESKIERVRHLIARGRLREWGGGGGLEQPSGPHLAGGIE